MLLSYVTLYIAVIVCTLIGELNIENRQEQNRYFIYHSINNYIDDA